MRKNFEINVDCRYVALVNVYLLGTYYYDEKKIQFFYNFEVILNAFVHVEIGIDDKDHGQCYIKNDDT